MSIADLLSENPDEDLLFVSNIKDRIYMPAEFFQKWVRPTIRVQKALKQSQDQEVQGAWKLQYLPPFSTNRSWILRNPITAT